MPKWFKVQTPAWTSGNTDDMQCLLYDENGNNQYEVRGAVADSIITALDMQPMADKVYVKATINKKGKFIVNKDTVTRKEMF